MTPVIVATDFSPIAFNAALYAADMAKSIKSYVVLLNVCPTPIAIPESPVVIDEVTMMNDAEKFMAEHVRQLIHRTKEQVIFETVVTSGNFYTELEAACQKWKPYCVVMGCQGSSEAGRLLFGNHVIHAMKHLPWPLIAVPPEARFSTIKKIGLATDFSDVAETTPLDELTVFVKMFNAELHVLNTASRPSHDSGIVIESRRLHKMLEPLGAFFHFITHKNTDEGILEFAEKNDIDLLIVVPRRHTLLEKLLIKSHTKQLVLQTHIPVMALHTS
jgi:nucleotide-binding universal stress UspA family protein